jgi:hypothetical protein
MPGREKSFAVFSHLLSPGWETSFQGLDLMAWMPQFSSFGRAWFF